MNMSFGMKKTFAKIKNFAANKPSVCTKFTTTTDIYRAASDKKPALSFNKNGNISLNILQMVIIVLGVVLVSIIACASMSAKYKKKYKKKLGKMKAKFEKKEQKLLLALPDVAEEE